MKERFMKKVDVQLGDNCWNWKASTFHHGYGCFGVPDSSGKFKIKYAHRVSYELFCGEIPEGLFVLHRCDNRKCVNPNHLWLGTQKENMSDARQKGRMKFPASGSGEANHAHKLTENDVRKIRAAGEGISQSRLAKQFGVSQTLVGHVLRKTIWTHVND